MNDPFEFGRFLLPKQVWLIGQTGGLDGLFRAEYPDGFILLVFTDLDLAQRAMETCPHPEAFAPIPVDVPLGFALVLAAAEDQGFTRVCIDGSERRGRDWPIARLRADVAKLL
jgi:hypothetical protein